MKLSSAHVSTACVRVQLQMEYTLKGYAFNCTHTLAYVYKNEVYLGLKGIVHPKNEKKIICSAEHKGRYFEKILWKSMVPQNCSVSHILQNIFLCVQQNKDIHTGLELLEGE